MASPIYFCSHSLYLEESITYRFEIKKNILAFYILVHVLLHKKMSHGLYTFKLTNVVLSQPEI